MHPSARGYYERGNEAGRLAAPIGVVEFERTQEIVLRHLPQPPAVVADIGGGPGAYAIWLAGLGYTVTHRDLMPLHVEQLMSSVGDAARIQSAVADARHLDLADLSVDALLLLGPLYHLDRREDRLAALGEAFRVLRPGGHAFVAAISRWAPRTDGVLRTRLYETSPDVEAVAAQVERTGTLPPIAADGFSGYCHRPDQLRSEVKSAGFELADLVAVEGLTFLLGDLGERLADQRAREVVLGTARALERVPELLGATQHLLATARRPG